MITPDLLRQRISICAAMCQSPVVGVGELATWVGLNRSAWTLTLRNLPVEWQPKGTFRAGGAPHMLVTEAKAWLERLTAEFPKQFGIEETQP